MGIRTAWALATADHKVLRRQFENVERTARELLGTVCFSFEDTPDRKQMIATTRSFGEKIFSLDDLASAITTFTSMAAVKLRAQQSMANCIQVFARTSHFTKGERFGGSRIIAMPYPTDDTRDLTQAALAGLRQFYEPGPAYAKAGIVLSQFVERGTITGDLFAPEPRANSAALMSVMDAINAKQGRGTIRLARDRSSATWNMRRELLSQEYTTNWAGMQRALCK